MRFMYLGVVCNVSAAILDGHKCEMNKNGNVSNFEIIQLSSTISPLNKNARDFCLSVIKEFYDVDYRPDWHADLDALVLGEQENWFSRKNDGGFWVQRSSAEEIVGTAAVHELSRKALLWQRLSRRYGPDARVAQLARVYVRADMRGKGCGSRLSQVAETAAREMGYDVLYLHASAGALRTLDFWAGMGFKRFDTIAHSVADGATEWSVEFEKHLRR